MARRSRSGEKATGGDADRPSTRSLRPLKLLIGYLAPYRLQIAGALVALTVAAATVLAMGIGLRHLIDDAFHSATPGALDDALLILFAVVVVLAMATFGRFFLVSWIGERVVADLRKAVYDRVLGLGPAFFEVTRTGEILSRLTTDTTLIQTVVGSSASSALRNMLLLAGGTVMLIVTSPRLTGFVLLVVPLVVAPILIFGRRVRKLSRQSQDRVADVGDYVEESLNAIRTVQAFNHEPIDRERFAERVESAFSVSVRRIRARAFLTAVVIMLTFGSVGVILWLGGRAVIADEITAGELSAFVFYAVVVAGAVGAVSEVVGDLQRAAGATERLMDLLASRSTVRIPERPLALPEPLAGAVAFENVTFHYPSMPDRSALTGLTFSVAPGEKVAIVGPSGAGKSTVFQLLLRFYDIESGHIRVDGLDIRDVHPAALRARIGMVPQDPVLFSTSAMENIRYGRPEATDAEVRAAAEAAAAVEFIDRLPNGFDTFLGQRGVRLSGGQRQRIAIARAVLRDPSILLLDEATSALDAESEQMVQAALDRLSTGRTTIVVAHRLATVLKADRIIVLDQGRVVGTGTHESLLAEGGLYARLAALQFDTALERGVPEPRISVR